MDEIKWWSQVSGDIHNSKVRIPSNTASQTQIFNTYTIATMEMTCLETSVAGFIRGHFKACTQQCDPSGQATHSTQCLERILQPVSKDVTIG